MDLNGMTLAFLGDSITEGCGTSDLSKRFTDLISTREGVISLNYGIGGTRIAYQLENSENPAYDRNFISRVDEMDPEADCILVFGGTNDFGHGDAPLGNFNDRSVYTFYGAMHTLCSKLLEKYHGKPIVILTPLHRCSELDPKPDATAPGGFKTLKTYVEAIREVAEYYSLPILDLYATSGLQPELEVIRENYIPDGLHPNDAGHKILADKIVAFLNNMEYIYR